MFWRPDNEIIFVGMMFHWVRFVSNSIRELLKNGRAVGAKPNFSACGAPMRHFFGTWRICPFCHPDCATATLRLVFPPYLFWDFFVPNGVKKCQNGICLCLHSTEKWRKMTCKIRE